MKYFLTIVTAGILLSGCNKKDEVKAPPFDSSRVAADSLQNVIKTTVTKDKVASHKGSLDALISLGKGGPIPPHMLPIKDTKFLEETDSTATYEITSGSTPAKAKVTMKQRVDGKDTVWVLSHIEDMK